MKYILCDRFVTTRFLISVLFVLLMSQIVVAGGTSLSDGITLDGTVRWRAEFDGKDYSNSTALNEKSYLRTRLGLKFTSIENTLVCVQIQDSRNLGMNSSGLTSDTNLGLHQGFIKLSKFPANNLFLQVGRFEAPYGRHRLLGNVGWHNVGRSFDGIRGSYANKNCKIDFFCFKIDERSFDNPPNHKDWKLYGIYGSFLEKRLDLFFLYVWKLWALTSS